jgi:hypothetical protein
LLSSPLGAVVAVADVEGAVAFFGQIGLRETGRGPLPAELYGGAGAFVDLAAADRGRVRVVETAAAPALRGAFDSGLAALDFYSRNLEQSLELVGPPAAPPVRIELGPLVMHQVRIDGPDATPVVLIDASSRRPSLLDHDPRALHSEAHSMVWVVPSIDEALPFWRDAGLSVAFDLPIASPAVAELLALPRSDVPVRMAMLTDEAVRPMRLELFEFPEDRGAAADATPRAGTAWPVFEVDDLDAALGLPWASTGPVVSVGGRRAARCVAPGGVVAELWQ